MSNRDFNAWLSGFRDSIADYGYYIDFEKVHRNVDNIKVELNILNSLIGSKNIEVDFENLMRKYPEVLKCIPLLLAVRANEIYCQDENGGHLFQFDFGKYPPNSHTHYERYKYFMRETGLTMQRALKQDLIPTVAKIVVVTLWKIWLRVSFKKQVS